jgi:hypothetical protein
MFPCRSLTHALHAAGLVLLAALAAAPAATGQDKHALVIAIADYPQSRDPNRRAYARLSGPLNDADSLVVPALRRQGFEVTTLRDGEATRAGFLAAFDALAQAARPGDLVVIHYSGHGHQVTDASGDEPDGYDEVLVPYGAPLMGSDDVYHGEQHVTDDELGGFIAELRQRVYPGGEVVLFFDSCHSGSATRGEMPVRGGLPPMGPPGPGAAATRGAGDAEEGVTGVDAPPGTRGAGDEGLAPYVFFAAAQHDELDHEMFDPNRRPRMVVGPLSYAVATTLSQLGEGETYRRLFERIEATMVAAGLDQQTPQAEGDLDTRVFSGLAVVQQPYVTVDDYDPALNEVYVESGLLAGLTEGSRLAFYPPNTERPEGDALAEGEVTYAGAYDAVVTLDGAAGADLRDTWGFVTRQALGDVRVPVALAPGLAEADALRTALGRVGIVEVVDAAAAPADRVEVREEGGQLVLVEAADGTVFRRLPRGAEGAQIAADSLGAYARARYLQRLRLSDPELQLRVEALPAQFNVGRRGECTADEAAVARGRAARDAARPTNAFYPGEHYAIRVENPGRHRAFFTVVSVRPNGDMTQLYPYRGAGDNEIDPGEAFLLPNCYVTDTPYGPDVLKVFVTDAPLDLTLLIEGPTAVATRGPGERGLLDDLFEAVYLDPAEMTEATRSGTLGAPPRAATTTEVVLQIENPGAP